MTQIFTGEGLGLNGSSIGLGSYGPKGTAALGQGGESVYVNAANGNLVLRQSDGFLADIGFGLDLFQTYNSLGDNSSSWRFNMQSSLKFNGKANAPGSTVTRIGEDGHQSHFIYDAQKQSYLPQDGGTARLTFDQNGWNYREGNQKTTSHYNKDGQLTDIHDLDGHNMHFTYTNGQLSSIADSSGKQQINWSFKNGLLEDVTTLSEGKIIHHLHYEYDQHQRVHKVSRDLGDGKVFWITYDYAGDSNRISDIKQSDGTSLHIDYDAQGRVKKMVDGEGRITQYSYEEGKTSITNSLGETWIYYYDERNRLTGVDGPESYSIRYNYEGNYLSSIVQGNQLWRFRYNEQGDCIQIEEPNGQTTKRVYDAQHQLLLETHYQVFDGKNHPGQPQTSRYIYDEFGHLLFSIKSDGTVTEYRYDEQGLLTSTRCYLLAGFNIQDLAEDTLISKEEMQQWLLKQNPTDVSLVEYQYDWRGQLTEELHYKQVNEQGIGQLTDALRTRYRYDAAGRLVEKSTPLDGGWSRTQYIYDDLGRLIQTIDNQNNSQKIEYDDLHQRIIQTDANGLQTIRIYDHSGLLLSVMRLDINHAYGSTTYKYDSAGRLVAETGVNGLTSYNFYDQQGRLIAKVGGNGHVTEYRYTHDGLPLSTHEYEKNIDTADWQKQIPVFGEIGLQSSSQDRISQIVYNQYNQIAYRIDAQGAVITYQYDAQGRVIATTAFANRLANYNSSELLVFDKITPLADALRDRCIFYYYDSEGRLQAEVNGEGYAKYYKYDRLGNLIETCRYFNPVRATSGVWLQDCPSDSSKDIHNYMLYDARNLKIAEIDGEGYLIEYHYNEAGQFTEQCAYAQAIPRPIIINEATDLSKIRPKSQTNDHHTYYSYNDLGWLVEEKKYNGLVTTYSYDEMGKLASKTLVDAKTNAVRQQRYRYDALGRIIQSLDELGCTLLNQSEITPDAIEQIWQKHSILFTYNQAGLLASKTNSLNQTTRYFYNEQAELRFTINADGAVTETIYNSFNQVAAIHKYSAFIQGLNNNPTTKDIALKLEAIKDARFDEVIRYEYNILGQLIAKYSGSKGITTTEYNTFGEMEKTSQKIDAKNSVISEYNYDRRGLLGLTINDSLGVKQQKNNEYDSFGGLTGLTDSLSNKLSFVLNKRGEQTVIINAANNRKLMTYDAFGRLLTETNIGGSKYIKKFIFDDQNNQLTLINPQTNSQIVTQFNAFGDKISIKDANGFSTDYFYDEKGQLIRVNSPEGAFKEYPYDELGRLSFEFDAGGHKIAYTYDAEGHILTKIVDPDGLKLTTSYQYDALGHQLQVTEANGCIKQFIYDDHGRLIRSCIDPNGLNQITELDYDDRGLLIRQTEVNTQGKNKVIAYEWDSLGRKIAVTVDPDGLKLKTSYEYDANGNVIAQIDPNGQKTQYIYDANNRCHYQINALGQVTEHIFDKNGNEIQTTKYAKTIPLGQYDELNIKSVLIEDAMDHYQFRAFNSDNILTQEYDGLGYLTLYDYDGNGNLIKKSQYSYPVSLESLKQGSRERPEIKEARVQNYIYDGLNRLRFQCDQFGHITESAYNLSGQLIAKTNFSKLIDISNLNDLFTLDQITAKLNRTPGQDQTIRYAYDQANNLTMEVSAQGVAKTYAYDGIGHLISSTIYATSVALSAEPLTYPTASSNDRTNHYIYDAAGREIYRISAEGRVLERRYDSVGNVIQELAYATLVLSASYTQELIHDALVNAQSQARTTGYEYDAAGRLTTQENALHSTTQYSYDAQGNVINKTEANHAVWTYKYDAINQLIETSSPSISVTTGTTQSTRSIISRNTYDSFGNIISVIRDAEGIKQTLQYEYDAANQKIKTIYPNSKVNSASGIASNQRQELALTLIEEVQYNAFGQVISSSDKANNWKHFAYDERGLLAYSVDAQGAVTHYGYDNFDRLTTKTLHASLIVLNGDSEYSQLTIQQALSQSANDRHEYYEYSVDNQFVAISKDSVSMYNSKTKHYEALQPLTRNTYNNFGELIQSSVKVNESEWANTYHYYNRDGKQIAVVDAGGYLTSYQLNAYGEIETTTEYADVLAEWNNEHYKLPSTNPKDRITVLAYDALGQLTSKTLKQVSFQRRAADGRYNTATEDLVTRYQYDALGHITATTDVKGNTAYCYYNELGQLIAKVAPPTQTGRAATTYSYDALGNLVETKQWAGGVQISDEVHFVLSASSANDITKRQEYDANGLLIAQSDGLNHKTYYSYDANGNLARSWSELSQTGTTTKIMQDKRYSYDKENRLLQTATFKTNGACKTDDVTYNAFGEVTAKGIDGHLNIHVDYDNLGRVWRSNMQGHYEIYVYDLMDRVTQIVTSTNGFSKQYENGVDLSSNDFKNTLHFDKDNFLFDLQRQNNVYDALGHLISQSKEFTKGGETSNGEYIEYINQSQEVDRWGNMLRFANPQGYQTYYDYNAFNEVIRQELPEIRIVDEHGVARYIKPVNSYAYDELGQAIAMIDANGHVVSKEYDALGHLIKETDAKGNSRTKQYNLLEQLTSATNERGAVTSYVYDQENRLIAVTTAGTEQKYEYDEAGQLIKQVKGKNETTSFWYDTLGNQIKRTDARGFSTLYEYDDAGHKVLELDAAGHSQSWLYNYEQLIEHTDLGGHKTTYKYNTNGLLREEQSTAGKHIKYRYEGNGNLVDYFDELLDERVKFSYDLEGRVIKKESGQGGSGTDGWLREIDQYQYDALGRLTEVRRRNPNDTDTRFPDKDHALLSIDYEYDAVGNIRHTQVRANYTGYDVVNNDDYYTYDENNRMTINKGKLIDGNIAITSSQGSSMSYDEAGNIKTAKKYEKGIEENYEYTYDKDNQLILVQKDKLSIQAKKYDSAGRVEHETSFDNKGHVSQNIIMAYEHGVLVAQKINNGYDEELSQTTYQYDNVGNMIELNMDIKGNFKSRGLTIKHHYSYELWDNYQQKIDEASQTIDGMATTSGKSVKEYNDNGQLKSSTDQQVSGDGTSNSTRYWNSSLEGIKAREDNEGKTNYLSINGKTIGDLRLDKTKKQHLTVYGGFTPTGSAQTAAPARSFGWKKANNFATTSTFLERKGGEQQNDGIIPESSQDNAGSYTLQAGDTLESVALQIYGDSSLWYLLADANGITDRAAQASNNGPLHIGQRINTPPVATGQHNTSSSRKVMNANEVIGNTSASTPLPASPPPLPKKHHGLFAKIIVGIVAVVATVMTAGIIGALSGAIAAGTSGSLFALGGAVLGGASSLGIGGSMGVGFAAGFIGNLATQGMSKAFGMQDSMSLKGALINGLATAATSGLLKGMNSSPAVQNIIGKMDDLAVNSKFNISHSAQMMFQNASNQGINLTLNKHQHFDWEQLGANGVLAGVMGNSAVKNFRETVKSIDKTGIVNQQAGALVNAGLTSLTKGSSFGALDVIKENLGNSIGNALIDIDQGISSAENEEGVDAYLKVIDRLENELEQGVGPLTEYGLTLGQGVFPMRQNDITYQESKDSFEEALNIQMNLGRGSKPQYWVGGKIKFADASLEQVMSFMDIESNMSNPKNKFQFMDLHYEEGFTAKDLNKFLKSKRMLTDKGEVFLKAAKDNDLHPVYLVVHALVESAHGKSPLARQNNFFGVGANDGKAYAAGTKFSQEHGWNTPDEGIMGGAQVISKKWVNHPSQTQCTLHAMRWNPINSGTNQYATDINWARSLSQMMANIINSKYSNYKPTLIIPQYRS